MPSLFILMPFIVLAMVNLPWKIFKNQSAMELAGLGLLAQIALSGVYPLYSRSVFPDPWGFLFNFGLAMDRLSLLMLFTIGIVTFVSLLVAQSTEKSERRRFHFINLLLISLIGMNTVVLVTDIFSLYVFIEITAMSLFVLIALDKTRLSIEGTFKYLVLSAIASVFMLSSTAFWLLVAGDLSFASIHHVLLAGSNGFFLKLAVGLFLCGLFIKSGVMPFHGWMPDAYTAAPAPVSVLLAGIVTKITGVYVLMRLFGSVFVMNSQLQNVLLFAGAFSIIAAALAALTQDNFKRMLAYSSISQVGYIILALGCATPLAFAGAAFHFFNHAIFKSLLFVNAAALEHRYGTTDMNKMSACARGGMAVTATTALIGFLSTAGIPPLAGFWSKFMIILALFLAGKTAYACLALLASTLTLAYFLALERRVFFCRQEGATAPTAEGGALKTPTEMTVAEILLAAITVAAGAGFIFILKHWGLLSGFFWN